MEVVLESAEGCPPNAVLSLKIGDTKRQAPLTKIGQLFRFTTSVLEPLPLRAELHVPAASAKTVQIDPEAATFSVDFGSGMRIQLRHQGAKEQAPRAQVDVNQVAESRGLTGEKVEVAQSAAAYLEKHGLVQLFQDMLHGILAGRPDDPLRYIEERVARTLGKAAKPSAAVAPDAASDTGSEKRRRRGSVGKVDAVLASLKTTHANLASVLTLLPPDFRDMITSEEFEVECMQEFRKLDKDMSNSLTPDELVPVLMELSTARSTTVTEDHCNKFIEMFDSDKDGVISSDEFVALVQYVFITAFLQDNDDVLQDAQIQETEFSKFIEMLERDKDIVHNMIPFLPEEVHYALCSDEFLDGCEERFTALDTDGSGTLEIGELIPLVSKLLDGQIAIDEARCERFVKLFDADGNGVICQDEFIDFAQFMGVVAYLQTTSEPPALEALEEEPEVQKEPRSRAKRSTGSKVDAMFESLKETHANLKIVLPLLPEQMRAELTSPTFESECRKEFEKLDKDMSGTLTSDELVPVLVELSSEKSSSITKEDCARLVDMFDSDKNGIIDHDEFVALVQYVFVGAFLESDTGKQLMLEAQLQESEYSSFLDMIETSADNMWTIIPFLLDDVREFVIGQDFIAECIANFTSLDTDESGALEATELIPLVTQLCQGRVVVDEAKCERFISVFDKDCNGVITFDEFVEFAQFMAVMSYLQGIAVEQVTAQDATSAGTSPRNRSKKASGSKVEAMLESLAETHKNLDMVLPLLPEELRDQLTSQEFEDECRDEFLKLDKDMSGSLTADELVPVLVELSSAKTTSVSEEHCAKLIEMFDSDQNGVISLDEFVALVQYVFVGVFLQSDEGKSVFLEAQLQESQYSSFLELIESNVEKMWAIVPFLPPDIRELVTSEDFMAECSKSFRELDADCSGTLEAHELIPLVRDLCEGKVVIDEARCEPLVKLFDKDGNGVITIDEFVEFAQFLAIMFFLESKEGKEVKEITDEICAEADAIEAAKPPSTKRRSSTTKVDSLLASLQETRHNLDLVVQLVPPDLKDMLTSKEFDAECTARFNNLDTEKTGSLSGEALVPVVMEICNVQRSTSVTPEQCEKLVKLFDADGNGTIELNEFVALMQYAIISLELQDESAAETMGKAAAEEGMYEKFITMIEENEQNLWTVLPFLPESFISFLQSEKFSQDCQEQFKALDVSGTGNLSVPELIPVVSDLSGGMAIDEEKCRRFVNIFDTDRNGVISLDEFEWFVKFIVVMHFLSSGEGAESLKNGSELRDTSLESQHLAIDAEFYQQRAGKLADENDELRRRLRELEDAVARSERKAEEKEMQLRHAKAELSTTQSSKWR